MPREVTRKKRRKREREAKRARRATSQRERGGGGPVNGRRGQAAVADVTRDKSGALKVT